MKRAKIGKLLCAAMLATVSVTMSANAQMQDADGIILDTERPLLLETLRLCSSGDIKMVAEAIPAFSKALLKVGIAPDLYDEQLASKGMIDFSAWGFDEDRAPEPLKNRSFFVEIRMQESSGRTVSFCQLTDMSTGGEPATLSLVEADWLKVISPLIATSSTKHETEQAKTATHDATFTRYFDISNDDAIQSISMLRVGHKVEITMMRAGKK